MVHLMPFDLFIKINGFVNISFYYYKCAIFASTTSLFECWAEHELRLFIQYVDITVSGTYITYK